MRTFLLVLLVSTAGVTVAAMYSARELPAAADPFALVVVRERWFERRDTLLHQDALQREVAELRSRMTTLASKLEPWSAHRRVRRTLQEARLRISSAERAIQAGRIEDGRRHVEAVRHALTRLDVHAQQRWARFRDPRLVRWWQQLADDAWRETRDGSRAVIVDKLAERAYLVVGGRAVEAYPIELGRNGLVDKKHAGDAATPEGRYRVVEKRGPGATRWHRALLLDYPNDDDRKSFLEAQRRGEIPKGRGIGAWIEIHGRGGRGMHWTDGCVALTDADMNHLFRAVEVGDEVTIVGRADLPVHTGARHAR